MKIKLFVTVEWGDDKCYVGARSARGSLKSEHHTIEVRLLLFPPGHSREKHPVREAYNWSGLTLHVVPFVGEPDEVEVEVHTPSTRSVWALSVTSKYGPYDKETCEAVTGLAEKALDELVSASRV